MPTALWNTTTGSWFTAANWDQPNPNPPFTPPLHYVPTSDEDVAINDNSSGAPFTVTYNGTATYNSLSAASPVTLSVTGGTLSLSHGGNIQGKLAISSGAAVEIKADTLQAIGADISGIVKGAGTFLLFAGNTTINAGASFQVANWTIGVSINGTGAAVTLNTDISYGGAFSIVDVSGNQSRVNLNGHTLTLSGTAILDGTFNGPGTVKVTGTAIEPSPEFNGNVMIGGAVLQAAAGSTITQQRGIGLGDNSSNGTLQIDAGAQYNITGDSSITAGGQASHGIITNNGTVHVSNNATANFAGTLTNNGTMTVDAGSTIQLDGTNTLHGTISGAGTLNFRFTSTTIATTSVSTAAITIGGGNSGALVKLSNDLTYGGSFTTSGQFDTVDLNGHTLTLAGTSSLAVPATIKGGKLKITGTATVGGNGQFGSASPAFTLENAGTVSQSGNITLTGTLQNDAAHAYTITNASNITGGTITNGGTFADSATGTSTVSGAFTNTGAISVGSGAILVLSGGPQTLGGTISGAGELVFGAGSAALNSTSITVSKLTVSGGLGGASVTLGANLAYTGTFAMASQFDTFDLGAHTLTLSGPSSFTSGSVVKGGTLKITGTATVGSNEQFGSASPAFTLENAGTVNQSGSITLTGTLKNDAAHTYTITSASNINGGTITNGGTFADTAPGTSAVSSAFTNTGTISIGAGATLILSGGPQTLGGTVSGTGELLFGAGSAALNTSNVTVSKLTVSGGLGGASVTLGTNLTYAGKFSSFGQFDTINLAAHTLKLTGTQSEIAAGAFTGSGTIEAAGTVLIDGGIGLSGMLQVDAAGTANINGGHIFDNGATIKNLGHINITGSSQADPALANTGTVEIKSAASLTLTKALSGSGGTVQIDAGASLHLGSDVAAGQKLAYNGIGSSFVRLDVPGNFHGAITGFGPGDVLDLGFETVTSFAYNGTTLTLNLQGGGTQNIALSGTTNALFMRGDGNGGTDIVAHSAVNDFNGDGKSDVLFSQTGAIYASNYEWQMNDRAIAAQGAIDLYDKAFTVQVVGDYDGDGKSDVAFYNPATGGVWMWLLNGTAIKAQGAVDVGDKTYHLLGSGDFNGDGKADLIFRNDAGIIYEWQMDGLHDTPRLVSSLSPSWHLQGAGDFDGDGKADLLLRNISATADNGAFYLWRMDGNTIVGQGGIERPPVAWKTFAVGDFDGDGKTDFAVRNASATPDNGAVWVYLMNGTTIKAQGAAGIADPNVWQVAQVGDLNGDGKDDILLRDTAGHFYSWDMNGTHIGSEGGVPFATPDQHVVSQHWDLV